MRNPYTNATKVIVDDLELEVNHNNKQAFFLERSKEGRKEQLRTFILLKLQERWNKIPKTQASLEKLFVREIIDSL